MKTLYKIVITFSKIIVLFTILLGFSTCLSFINEKKNNELITKNIDLPLNDYIDYIDKLVLINDTDDKRLEVYLKNNVLVTNTLLSLIAKYIFANINVVQINFYHNNKLTIAKLSNNKVILSSY